MLSIITILISITSLVQSANWKYTTVAKVQGGGSLQCVNNCINGKCIYHWRGNEANCEATETPAPVFHTSQARGTRKYCLSRCANFEENYEWCYTSNNNDWDYCSSVTRSQGSLVIKQRFTKHLGPCKDYCIRGTDNVHRCTSFWGEVDECINKGLSYMQAKTVEGMNCVGTCNKHDNTKYFWCYDSSRKFKYCAPPARPRLL